MSVADEKSNVFIIRFWHEPRENKASDMIWRGSVEHLETRDVQYFQKMTTLVAFITRHTGIAEL